MDRFAARMLIIIGVLCLLQAAVKPILWFAGARATGVITHMERGVSKTGALWLNYSFTTKDNKLAQGSAMAGGVNSTVLHRKVQVAYLPFYPDINMPASAGYAAVIFGGWTLTGLFCMVVGRVIDVPRRKKTKDS